MAKKSSGFRESLRALKNEIVRKYFEYRIQTPHDPYSVLFRPQPYRILFILSHMRSGSSLLTHILSSNPEIMGYGETHLQYASEADFKKLMLKVCLRSQESRGFEVFERLNMNSRYILDKVLHNNKFINTEFIKSENLYFIFLIREPQRSLASICELKQNWNSEQALRYYAGRLDYLQQYARIINGKKRSLFITYEQLLNQSNLVFEGLQKLLNTQNPFSEEYQILKTTGMKSVGDSKGNIKAGRIVREKRKIAVDIEPELADLGIQSFEQCSQTLSKYCQTISTYKI
ncbi:MAG: sulfotransferase [Cyanobacteriota bacterium]|nr:sulfotransferase [Cyanobacteriota bacterium]